MVTQLIPFANRSSSSAEYPYESDLLDLFQPTAPLGYAGNDTNLFRYVGNGPTNATDPTGQITAKGKKVSEATAASDPPLSYKVEFTDFTLEKAYDVDVLVIQTIHVTIRLQALANGNSPVYETSYVELVGKVTGGKGQKTLDTPVTDTWFFGGIPVNAVGGVRSAGTIVQTGRLRVYCASDVPGVANWKPRPAKPLNQKNVADSVPSDFSWSAGTFPSADGVPKTAKPLEEEEKPTALKKTFTVGKSGIKNNPLTINAKQPKE